MAWPGLEAVSKTDTSKRYRRWTDRVCDPEETWKRIHGLLPTFGITRVADLTGLDRVGLPVYAAYRPLSLCLVTSMGKGVTHAAARVSAAMEAIEKRAAERPAASMRRATLRELSEAQEVVVDVARLPRLRAEGLGRDVPILWVEGHELGSGRSCWVPHERVTTDYSALADPERDVFTATTTGLASGNTLPEATLHALCEAIERDARALWELSGHRQRDDLRLDLATVADRDCRAVLDRLDAAGVQAAVWDITSDVGVAAFCLQGLRPIGAGRVRDRGDRRVGMPSQTRDRADTGYHRGSSKPPGAHLGRARRLLLVGVRVRDVQRGAGRDEGELSRGRAPRLHRRAEQRRRVDRARSRVAARTARGSWDRRACTGRSERARRSRRPRDRAGTGGADPRSFPPRLRPGASRIRARKGHGVKGAVILFVGPTLPAAEATEVIDATAVGPAAHGDLLGAARSAPAAIGLVDGYFERVPAVWHKEILWAHVARGARSTARRAWERCAPPSSPRSAWSASARSSRRSATGCWRPTTRSRCGTAPQSTATAPTSEALVDIRATLHAATAAGVIPAEVEGTLVQFASAMHYPDRIYPRLLAEALRRGVDAQVVGDLERWLPTGRVSQKAIDARAMLDRIATDLRAGPPTFDRACFVRTGFWDRACRELDSRRPPGPAEPALDPVAVVDELRLDPRRYDLLRRAALLRVARRTGWAAEPSEDDIADACVLRHARLGLPVARDPGTSTDEQSELGTEDAALDLLAREQRSQLDRRLCAELRHSGGLRELESRARDKQRVLDLHGLSDATTSALGIDMATVLEDHCYARGLRSHPRIELLSRALDLPDPLALQRLLVAERAYQRVLRGEQRGRVTSA